MPGATPVFGFPYPDPSDLVANYPALGQQLAEDVEDEIIAAGKIKQIVRATDTTGRVTSSTSFVDVTGMSVTITPQSATSNVIIIASFQGINGTAGSSRYQITNSANTAISGAQDSVLFPTTAHTMTQLIAFDSPATVSAVTYKMRFYVNDPAGSNTVANNLATGQMYAIEVSP